jgi:hypothetical protein
MSYVLNLQKLQYDGYGVDWSTLSQHCSSQSTNCDVPRDPTT